MDNCHLSCSYYNCKRTYTNAEALHSHQKDHQRNPALALPGKSFLCSTIGCDGSFSNMQQLMDHLRIHHKPNYFFLCESCRAKLRSYRTLLKHLQTCAKVAKSKAAKVEGGTLHDSAPGTAENLDPSMSFMASDLPHDVESDNLPFGHAQTSPTESTAPLEAGKPQYQLDAAYSPIPPSLSPAPEPEPQRSPRTGPSGLASSPPCSPPASNAVWRKNQGQSFSSRILWEHTRGRYSCLQCGHSTPERKEITAHIEGQHRGPGAKANTEKDAVVGSPSCKTLGDSENTVYTPQ